MAGLHSMSEILKLSPYLQNCHVNYKNSTSNFGNFFFPLMESTEIPVGSNI